MNVPNVFRRHRVQYQLLSNDPQRSTPDNERGERLGTFRAVYLVAVCCMGSFLFAYDTGIVGGILTFSSFQRDFRYTVKQKTQVNSNCVSILQAGAFFGCFAIWPITVHFGRRKGLMISSFVFIIGSILQVINAHSIGLFYAGRVISGFGVGGATVLVPMFSAEMAPKEIRGKLGSCFQLFFAAGVCVSYWVDYAVQIGISRKKSSQWQVPVGLQLVPGAILFLGTFLIPESVRWLAKHDRVDAALESLTWVRGGTLTPAIFAEFAEIQAGLAAELSDSQTISWHRSLLQPSNRYRLFIAITIQLCAQLTGNTSLAYYAPQIFATIGAGNANGVLFITGFFGIVKIAGVLAFLLLFVERFGRRPPFMAGAAFMGSCMLVIACIVATHPPTTLATGITSYSAIGIAMVYLEAFFYNTSWGPLPWLYIGEIFPNATRELGIAVGAASQWLFNFVLSQITPHAIANIGWRTFLIFAIFNYGIIVYSYFLLKETQGRSLEEMEDVFGSPRSAKRGDSNAGASEAQTARRVSPIRQEVGKDP